jgi:hypothetical protein
MPPTVAHHARCPACDYDLYTTPLDGRCPECGTPVPRRKGLDESKNPRRVNSQHLTRLRRARRNLWWAVPATVVPLAVAVGSFWFPVSGWLRIAAWVLVVTGALTLFELWIEITYHSGRMVPEDGETGA